MGPTGRLARLPVKTREAVYEGELDGVRGVAAEGHPSSLFNPPESLRPGSLDLVLPTERPEEVDQYRITVRASDIDIFKHVNAANYVRYVASALSRRGGSESIHRAELKYSGQAVVGDVLDVLTWSLSGDVYAADILRGDEVLFRPVVETESSSVL